MDDGQTPFLTAATDVKPEPHLLQFDFAQAADYGAGGGSYQPHSFDDADMDFSSSHLGPHEHDPPDAGDEGDSKRPRLRLGASRFSVGPAAAGALADSPETTGCWAARACDRCKSVVLLARRAIHRDLGSGH